MLESLLTPHSNLSVRSLLVQVPSLPPRAEQGNDELRWEIDQLVAKRIQAWRGVRTVLDPIPVLAIPGFSDNDAPEFYEDMRNIRFEPISRRPVELSVD